MLFDWTLIKEQMQRSVVEVTFTKANGSDRTMQCTLCPDLIPETKQASNHTGVDTMVVFDLEAEGWRSFRFDRVTKVGAP